MNRFYTLRGGTRVAINIAPPPFAFDADDLAELAMIHSADDLLAGLVALLCVPVVQEIPLHDVVRLWLTEHATMKQVQVLAGLTGAASIPDLVDAVANELDALVTT